MAPRSGRWIAEDRVYTESRYGYGGGSPANRLDPSGRSTEYALVTKDALCRAALATHGDVIVFRYWAISALEMAQFQLAAALRSGSSRAIRAAMQRVSTKQTILKGIEKQRLITEGIIQRNCP